MCVGAAYASAASTASEHPYHLIPFQLKPVVGSLSQVCSELPCFALHCRRITNRESAKRMRIKRQEELANIQKEVMQASSTGGAYEIEAALVNVCK